MKYDKLMNDTALEIAILFYFITTLEFFKCADFVLIIQITFVSNFNTGNCPSLVLLG